jgi:hypothetical protein
LDASLKILFDDVSDDELNLYEQMFVDGMVNKTLVGVYPINDNGEAFVRLPESMISRSTSQKINGGTI